MIFDVQALKKTIMSLQNEKQDAIDKFEKKIQNVKEDNCNLKLLIENLQNDKKDSIDSLTELIENKDEEI